MNISLDQVRAALSGQPVVLTAEGTDLVLIRRDVYERATDQVEYDDSEWTTEEMMLLAAEATEDLDNMDEIKP